MSDPFQITRLDGSRKTQYRKLAEAFDGGNLSGETWLFVAPHDDDLCLSCGLLMQQAVAERANVQVLVVTDGRMGYCTLEQRDSIVEIRRKETYDSFGLLGVPKEKIQYIAYPDGGLTPLCGRRRARSGDEVKAIEGYVGLQNAFTYHLRRTRATRVFVPTSADLHPDHQVTHSELMICLFHAAGTIWPELGEPLADVPRVYELAVYCDFPAPPQLQLEAGGDAFEKKLASIAAFQSQTQIARLVETIRQAGPTEYVRELNFRFYSPNNYKPMFA
ncbi:MAG TPA: PIG-L family deacetylase [Tepidisphaeraceae bacterium]|nr:PIG-L family deacetylase [Tepidisphaeraceae bacterium]